MTLITINNITLRPIEQNDAARFAVLCNDKLIAENTARIPHPYSIEDARDFVKHAKAEFTSDKEYRFAVCRNDVVVACCGVIPKDEKSCDLGYWVGAEDRGKGVASRAASAVVEFAFQYCGANIITAGHFTDNPASRRVLEKLGFQPTGEMILTMSLARGAEVETARFELHRENFVATPGIHIEG